LIESECRSDALLTAGLGDTTLYPLIQKLYRDAFGGGIWFWGAKEKIGNKSHSYYQDITSTETSSTDKDAWSLDVSIGQYYIYERAWSLTYTRSSTYKDLTSSTFCQALLTACLTGPIGSPTHQNKSILTFQLRTPFGDNKQYAYSVNVSHDFELDNSAVEVPVYLYGNDTGLNSGVAFTWNEQDSGLNVGLFIGQNF
jgi:hypothetical protein